MAGIITTTFVRVIDGTEINQLGTITTSFNIGQRGVAGRSVVSIIKTDTQELTDTYTITYSDNTTSTFDVVNGYNGADGKTAYQSAVDGGYTGTEADFNADLALVSTKADLVNGLVPASQLPSYVDDVIEVANFAALPVTGESGKIYITQDDNLTYRWSGTGYAEISKSLALGETSSTAYRGDRGKTAYDHSQITGNPHGTTASEVGASPLGHNHSGEGINPDYVVLDAEYTDTTMLALPVGSLFYNIDQLAWLLKTTANTYLNLGEENTYIAKNGDSVTHLEGQVTYITSGGGNLDVMTLASSVNGKIDALLTQDVLHTGNGRGMYCFGGKVRTFPYSNVIKSTDNENTWVEGAELYLCSEAGRYSTTKEAAPAKCSIVGKITQRNGANISVSFRPFKAISVSDLSDVDGEATTVASGDSFFLKVGNLWKTITESNFLSWFRGLSHTFTQLITFSGNLKTTKIIPNSDTTGFVIRNAADSADVVKVDTANNRVGINDSTPEVGFKVLSPFGEFLLADNKIGAKVFRFGMPHFNQANHCFLITGSSYSGNNDLQIGGGSSRGYAVTLMRFYTALNNTTTTGSLRMSILPSGDISYATGKYRYEALYDTADTINDIRTSNQSGVFKVENCTVANAIKGSGTWVEIFRIDSNGFQSAQYDDIEPADGWENASGGAAPDTATHTIAGMAANFRAFDGNATEESMSGKFEILHDVDIASLNAETLKMEIHAHGMAATTGSGVVKLFYDLVYLPAPVSGVSQAPIAWGTFSSLITINANEQYHHKICGVELTKPSSGFNIGDQILAKLRRTPSDAQDTYTGDWLHIQCALHAPKNSNGSRQRYVK